MLCRALVRGPDKFFGSQFVQDRGIFFVFLFYFPWEGWCLHQHRCGLLFLFFYFYLYFYFYFHSGGEGRERSACFNESSYLFLFICIFFVHEGVIFFFGWRALAWAVFFFSYYIFLCQARY